jgi:Ser/Thr protein kinase RdoA (MazF antagonist)
MNEAEPLPGGHRTPVVRVGNTVRRPWRDSSPAVQALLRHLERASFSAAPRALGRDRAGREVLSFLDGSVASGSVLPSYVWSDETLCNVGGMLRALHEATVDFRPPRDAVWESIPDAPGPGDVICHNDIAPWNTLFVGGRPRAFLDWDSAAPGTRIWDLAYAAWHWIPLWPPDRCREHGFHEVASRPRRLRLLCAAYGLVDPPERRQLVPMIERRQRSWLQLLRDRAAAGEAAYSRMVAAGAEDGVLADMHELDELRTSLLRAI